MQLNLAEAKWISMLGVGFGSFAIGVIPACYLARRGRTISRKLFLSSMLCFGGGVLLATAIVHMLPDTRRDLPHFAELVFCCGFLLLYLIDETVHYFSHQEIRSTAGTTLSHGTLTLGDDSPASTDRSQLRASSTCVHGLPNRRTRHQELLHREDVYEVGFSAASSRKPGREEPRYSGGVSTKPPRIQQYGSIPPTRTSSLVHCGEADEYLCHTNHSEPCTTTKAGHVGLAIALTLHALLEGLAVGLQRNPSQVLLLAGAIISHKFVVAFCLGLELAESGRSLLRNIMALTFFSGGSSLGIGIGMLVVKVEASWAAVVVPVLQGLAGGTLLYVTVSEVLPRERARWHANSRRAAGLIQFASVVAGFAVMFCLNRYLDPHHMDGPPRA